MKLLEELTFTDDFFDYGGEDIRITGRVIWHDAAVCRAILEMQITLYSALSKGARYY